MSEHYLTADTWSVDGQPELGEVRLASIHHIDRTIAAIHVIARMIGNSAYGRTPATTRRWTRGPCKVSWPVSKASATTSS